MTFLYFAYGSNMLPARLQARCPSARVIGRAAALHHHLAFSKIGMDGSAKATLAPAPETLTPGVLFEIEVADLRALDRAEGAGFGYDRDDSFAVKLEGSAEPQMAVTYIASRTDAALKPFDWYLGLVLAGAQHNALGEDHLNKLRAVPFVVDRVRLRKGRRDALAALTAHEVHDLAALLRGG